MYSPILMKARFLKKNLISIFLQLNLILGFLTDLQFHLLFPYAWSIPPPTPTKGGIGDTEIGFKYRFMKKKPHFALKSRYSL